jgi:hypothetical protein
MMMMMVVVVVMVMNAHLLGWHLFLFLRKGRDGEAERNEGRQGNSKLLHGISPGSKQLVWIIVVQMNQRWTRHRQVNPPLALHPVSVSGGFRSSSGSLAKFAAIWRWRSPIADLSGLPIRPHWVDAPPQRLGWSPCGETANWRANAAKRIKARRIEVKRTRARQRRTGSALRQPPFLIQGGLDGFKSSALPQRLDWRPWGNVADWYAVVGWDYRARRRHTGCALR